MNVLSIGVCVFQCLSVFQFELRCYLITEEELRSGSLPFSVGWCAYFLFLVLSSVNFLSLCLNVVL